MSYFQPQPRPMDMGAFKISPILPGLSIEGHKDHGYGPLARFDLSQLDPGGRIPMHPHQNDEIVTYMLQGALRHTDSAGSSFDVTPSKLMVMNAGRLFEHEEAVPRQAAITAKWIQIFVRPRRANLEPLVQLAELPELQEGTWRHLAGNERSSAPTLVRNDVDIYDAIAESGELTVPRIEGRHAMVHVWRGTVTVDGRHLTAGEGILLAHEDTARIQVHEAAGLLVFLVALDAPVSHSGTIGH